MICLLRQAVECFCERPAQSGLITQIGAIERAPRARADERIERIDRADAIRKFGNADRSRRGELTH